MSDDSKDDDRSDAPGAAGGGVGEGTPEGEERQHVTITLVSRAPRPAEAGGKAKGAEGNPERRDAAGADDRSERILRHFRRFEEHLDDLGGLKFEENALGMWNEGGKGFIELSRRYAGALDEARWERLDETMADIALVHRIRPSLAVRRNPQGACTLHVFGGADGKAAYAAFGQLDRLASFDWVDEGLADPNPAPITGLYTKGRILIVEFPGLAATGRNAARLPGVLKDAGIEATHRRYRADAKLLYALETIGESRPLPDARTTARTVLYVPEPGV